MGLNHRPDDYESSALTAELQERSLVPESNRRGRLGRPMPSHSANETDAGEGFSPAKEFPIESGEDPPSAGHCLTAMAINAK